MRLVMVGAYRFVLIVPGVAGQSCAHCTTGMDPAHPPPPPLQILENPKLLSVSFGKLRNVNGDWKFHAPASLSCVGLSETEIIVAGELDCLVRAALPPAALHRGRESTRARCLHSPGAVSVW
jgi:hypothetical protein